MLRCMRCNKEVKYPHPIQSVCNECMEKNPNFSVREKEAMGIWDQVGDFLAVYNRMKEGGWIWAANTPCKYINLRIDMRDGGCLIKDRDNNRVSPNQLAWQYSEETPNPPED